MQQLAGPSRRRHRTTRIVWQSALALLLFGGLRLAASVGGRWATATATVSRWSQVSTFGQINWSIWERLRSPVRANPQPRVARGWPFVISAGSVVQSFGWDRHDGVSAFSPDVEIAVHPDRMVLGGPGGEVVQVRSSAGGFTVTIAVGPHLTLAVGPVQDLDVHRHQTLLSGAAVGRTATDHLSVAVRNQGYPVNPFGPSLFRRPDPIGGHG